jgi:hypothetical protein
MVKEDGMNNSNHQTPCEQKMSISWLSPLLHFNASVGFVQIPPLFNSLIPQGSNFTSATLQILHKKRGNINKMVKDSKCNLKETEEEA